MTSLTNPFAQAKLCPPGYAFIETLYQGTKTMVFRAVEITSQQSVVIKVPAQEYPSLTELIQFRNQYAVVKNLPVKGIVRPLDLVSCGNSYGLVMDDLGGISLAQYIKQHPLNLTEILSIAIQLAETLHELHQYRVIHKDIKPANILIYPDSKQVKLIDFSIASLLPKETQVVQSPKSLEGTLAYLAPEQTGRMNRAIDYRTDFYALGVTLYQLLAGQLPFTCKDPLELIHCHIALNPKAVNQVNPAVPAMVVAIVAKLMAKNAEDRYQSALGLKYDLEQCLIAWKEQGEIAEFPLGQSDLSDRFVIPERLYGREVEVKTILDAFDRVANGASELMLVAGFSGIGKTAVVSEVHKPIVKQRGYFIKGKFDQFNRDIPLSAFVQALQNLIGQLLSESDAQIQTWKSEILAAVGENGQVLIEVIPELEQIIGPQLPVPELSGSAAQNRFNVLFQKFIAVFTRAEHPLVLFLDDLQWADTASLQLIKLLTNDHGYLLMLGAYRDNEVSPVHPFMLMVEELQKTQIIVNTITLLPLHFEDINRLVADMLTCSLELAQPLTELINRKTQGNPFFITQFLKTLHGDDLITFNRDRGYWECDIAQITALALTDNVVAFMAQQLQKLPSASQESLKLAACIGNQFDLNTLTIVSGRSPVDVATALWQALQEGLIVPISQVYKFFQDGEPLNAGSAINPRYRFLHDRIQQAAYSLIPDDQKQRTHLKLGQRLQQNLSAIEQEEKLFEIAGHFNLGRAIVQDSNQRESLAQLNLAAGQKAKQATAYAAAQAFIHTGLELLTTDCWKSQYALALALHVAATETAYLNANFETMESMATVVLNRAQTPLDKVKIYEIQINTLTAQSHMLEAIAVGAKALAELGITFSSEPDEVLMGEVRQKVAGQLEGKSIEDLTALPVMSDPQTIAAVKLLAELFSPVFLGNPMLLPLLAATMVNLSLELGNAPASTIGYVAHGIVLSSFLGEVEQGYRFGQLALQLLAQFHAKAFESLTLLLFGSFLQHRKESLQATISTVKRGYLVGIETGNFLYAGYNSSTYFYDNLIAGVSLETWGAEIENYCVALAAAKQHSPLTLLKLLQQSAHNLRETTEEPDRLIGTAYDETVMFPKHHQDNDLLVIALAHIHKLLLAYLFDNYDQALDYIAQINLHLTTLVGMPHIPIFHFYGALTYLARYSNQSETKQAKTLLQVENHQSVLVDWAYHAPMNCQHKVDLVDAEKCRVLGQNYEAADKYDRAIAGAKENSYLHEEALANELAAKFYLEWGKERVAAAYMQEAYYKYSRWGAKAKITDLETRYPELLRPILQQTDSSASMLNTLMTIAAPAVAVPSNSHHSSSSTSPNQTFDFASILQASQTLSSTIQLDELLRQLTQILLRNSGGNRCALILPNENGEWQVRAIATPDHIQLYSEPLTNNPRLPVKLIQYVKNTKEVVIVDNLVTDLPVIDDYLRQRKPKSVLCLPLLNQGHLIGILYLKNRQTRGVFTNDRIVILNFLCTQAAISLENARLYQQVHQTLDALQQAQLQLVQSEKMSALGNLVAGVAHEINNPVGCIIGNVGATQSYIDDLLGLLDLYSKQFPDPGSDIEEELEAVDLDYVRRDLPKLIRAMKDSGDRIKSISKSLRTFSRADTETKQAFDLREGIESTVLILRHRLKANTHRPAIEVVTDYGNIPEINCFPGQLNQVFMNILTNAIDALDEASQDRSFADIEAAPPCIAIRTEVEDDWVKVAISDNGLGMPDDTRARIFDHLFTTKGVGKGTGLGLTIARQIVVETHGGTLEVRSKVGRGTEFCICLLL